MTTDRDAVSTVANVLARRPEQALSRHIGHSFQTDDLRHLLFYLHIDLDEFIVENAPRFLTCGLTNEVVNKE